LSIISPRKRERIKKKVIPHLKKALDHYNGDSLEKSERELIIAITNLRKEKTSPPEMLHDFAALYNNLGARYVLKKDFEKAFRLFSKSLDRKLECEPRNIQSVEGTFKNMFTAGLSCCKFDELLNIIKNLLAKYSSEQNFKSYLEMCLKSTERVQNNEPELFISGMRIGGLSSSRNIDDLMHFPKAFEDIEMDFESQLILSDHATLDCSFAMSPQNPSAKIPVPYEIDSWKKQRPQHLESKIKNGTPNLIIFLFENEHIPSNTIKIKDRLGNMVEFDFKIVSTEFYVPDSYPRFGYCFGDPPEIPTCKSFKYFRGRAGVLEWEMKPGEEYRINLNVKNYEAISSTNSQFRMRVGILIPFKKVRYSRSSLKHASKVTIEVVQQKMIKYFEDRGRPSSFLLVDEPDSLSEKQFADGFTVGPDSEKQLYDIIPESCKVCDGYSIFGVSFNFRVSPENLSITTFEWEQPVPTAISHLLMDERFGFPPLCQYDIINNSKREVVLSLRTEIEGFTNIQEEGKTILPYSRMSVNHTPLFKLTIANLSETCVANLKTCSFVGDELIVQRTTRISLLAFDTMIWEILNPLTRQDFNLHNFAVVWVTPHDKEVEKLISIAKENHPERVLQGYTGTLPVAEIRQSTNLQCKAIFTALKAIGISYVDSSLSFGWLRNHASQRIKTPSTSIRTRAANCIDGTVLFASLLECIGIQSIIILVPGHALIGWRPYPGSTELVLLETTQIANADFETATNIGKESLNKGLEDSRKMANNPELTIEEAVARGYVRFIDVNNMREKNVFPQLTSSSHSETS
jgi:hypothetical protein